MNESEFLAMGGYGAYVWPCFLLTMAVLAWNAIAARRLHARARRDALRRLDAAGGQS
ncbi:MAG: heme exporter protein CcmD [Steroidobacteraceae bacterium]